MKPGNTFRTGSAQGFLTKRFLPFQTWAISSERQGNHARAEEAVFRQAPPVENPDFFLKRSLELANLRKSRTRELEEAAGAAQEITFRGKAAQRFAFRILQSSPMVGGGASIRWKPHKRDLECNFRTLSQKDSSPGPYPLSKHHLFD